MKRASPKLGRLLRHPFAATVAARTPDFSRIALTFARAPFGSGRCAAIYRPCCWYNFRVAAEIFGFLLAILRFAILALRAIGNDLAGQIQPRVERSRPELPLFSVFSARVTLLRFPAEVEELQNERLLDRLDTVALAAFLARLRMDR